MRHAGARLGRVAEQATASGLFTALGHSYTWLLIAAAMPPGPLRNELKARYLISGEPPSPVDPPPGCRFVQRCPFSIDRCRSDTPLLKTTGPPHYVACYRKHESARSTLRRKARTP